MSEFYLIYIYTVLGNIVGFAHIVIGILSVIFVIAVAVSLVALITEEEWEAVEPHWKRFAPVVIKISIPCVLLMSVYPDTDDIKLIIGGGMAWKATQIEGIEDLPKNVVSAMNDFLVGIEEEHSIK